MSAELNSPAAAQPRQQHTCAKHCHQEPVPSQLLLLQLLAENPQALGSDPSASLRLIRTRGARWGPSCRASWGWLPPPPAPEPAGVWAHAAGRPHQLTAAQSTAGAPSPVRRSSSRTQSEQQLGHWTPIWIFIRQALQGRYVGDSGINNPPTAPHQQTHRHTASGTPPPPHRHTDPLPGLCSC